MTEGSLITDDLKKLIGVSGEPVILEVEEGAIRRYAQAIGDRNPLHNDVEYARNSQYGRLICPPGFTGWPVNGECLPHVKLFKSLFELGVPTQVLGGSDEFEFFLPIGAGDKLVAKSKIIDMSEKEAGQGKLLFTTFETTFQNLNGNVVLKYWSTAIYY